MENNEELISTDDILGKEVIDIDGSFIGIAQKIIIDLKKIEITGIEIDKGFLRKGLRIGKNYIERITPYAIFLKIKPFYKIIGMDVFDKDGKKIGKVSDLKRFSEKNIIKSLEIKTGITKKIEILPEEIEKIEENVFLKIKKDEINLA